MKLTITYLLNHVWYTVIMVEEDIVVREGLKCPDRTTHCIIGSRLHFSVQSSVHWYPRELLEPQILLGPRNPQGLLRVEK